jgi:hypothetical protein
MPASAEMREHDGAHGRSLMLRRVQEVWIRLGERFARSTAEYAWSSVFVQHLPEGFCATNFSHRSANNATDVIFRHDESSSPVTNPNKAVAGAQFRPFSSFPESRKHPILLLLRILPGSSTTSSSINFSSSAPHRHRVATGVFSTLLPAAPQLTTRATKPATDTHTLQSHRTGLVQLSRALFSSSFTRFSSLSIPQPPYSVYLRRICLL